MYKDWNELTQTLSQAMAEVRKGAPDMAKGFGALAAAATASGALDTKTKELLAIAIAIAVRCDGCIGFHVKAALKAGASREEVVETVAMSVYMGGGPSFIYGAQALEAYDQFAA